MKKTIVVSAISLRSGGTLSILCDCLAELNTPQYENYKIYALVKDCALLDKPYPNIQFIERSGSGFYLKRLFYEFIYFRLLSKKLNPYLWLSLHDISPNVKADVRAVYCHNPTPFHKAVFRDYIYDPTHSIGTRLYKYLYQINIKKNDYVIVQQDWIRTWFVNRFNLNTKKVVVARPNVTIPAFTGVPNNNIRTFIFPSLPRVFKNFELIGEAIEILLQRNLTNFKVIITIDGTENRYSKWLKKEYGNIEQLSFIGLKPRNEIFELYSKVDCLIFPSKLETWGLPLTEFKGTNKMILASSLPYAFETIGDYSKALFFSPFSPVDLADKMEAVMSGRIVDSPTKAKAIAEPVTNNWQELFSLLLHKD